MSEEVKFHDILSARRAESSIFQYMTRPWHPQKTFKTDKYYSPQELKDAVERSVYIDAVIEAESARTGVHKEKLRMEVHKYLDEMGLEKKQCVIRWMGSFFLKMSFMMKIGLFVNEAAVLKLKSTMGNNPLLFLPTHRSYADFCIMTYLCYHYDIDFPAVAAGMDFYSMAVVGRCMRDTCAFYIRRTLAGERLYAATLRQYVRTLVSRHCSPIEFFIEGTRSRSNKSLPPKYGMLAMSMAALLAGEVSDITIVPVNISYDRLMEHGLFAHEHLGVPKPKESTGHLLKALRTLNDNFGNIYINLGEPLSVKRYFESHTPRTQSSEMLKPVDLQQLTPHQFSMVQDLAHHVVNLQQANTVLTITNLVALVLMQSLFKNRPLAYEEVIRELRWMHQVLVQLGALVFETDVEGNLDRVLVVHSKLFKFDKERKLRLISGTPMDVASDVAKKIKGHALRGETAARALPVIQAQLYVNPALHRLAPPALLSALARRPHTGTEHLKADYRLLRTLLRHEFFHLDKTEEQTLSSALEYCVEHDVLSTSGDLWTRGGDEKLQFLLGWSLAPALATLDKCAAVMWEQKTCEHKRAIKLIQERVESSQCHPYCLSLESIANCLQGLVLAGALIKEKIEDKVVYEVQTDVMGRCCQLVSSVLQALNIEYRTTNSVILDPVIFPSRL